MDRFELPGPVRSVTLRVPSLARAEARTLPLLEPEAKADVALPRLVAELSAEIGDTHVGVLALADTWHPHERTHLVPVGTPCERAIRPVHAPEPSRMVSEPIAISRDRMANVTLLLRTESVEWWRRGLERRDLVAAWVDGAIAWVEMSSEVSIRGWVD
jgi:hypothetical protein